MSQCRQNFHADTEDGINKQINMELRASYTYQSMAFYFRRDDVALKGFEKFFSEASKEEREHAEKLMKYQTDRGGRVALSDIAHPAKSQWASGLEAMQDALALEKTVNDTLLALHTVGQKHNDPHFTDFLENEFLDEQVKSIKKLADHVTNLKRVGAGLGEYMFDHESLDH